MLYSSKFKKISSSELYEISMRSSKADSKEVCIFEIDTLWLFLDKEKAESVRKSFLENGTKVKQITNNSNIEQFSYNVEFTDEVMTYRYIPKDIFTIHHEILIFDDIVAVYDSNEIMIIQDEFFAINQKQLFMSLWKDWISPNLNFEYKPNHSFYNSLDYFIKDIQVIVWPDADSKLAYWDMSQEELGKYLEKIVASDKEYYNDASYLITFLRSYQWSKMIDVWKFTDNGISNRSGPLGEVRVYEKGLVCSHLWLASGNTLLVLWYEEKLRRQSLSTETYLKWPLPVLPLEVMNRVNYF